MSKKFSSLSNGEVFVLIGGINVLESKDFALRACEHYVSVTKKAWYSLRF